MNDSELVALTVLVDSLKATRIASNAAAEYRHQPPEYDDDTPFPELDDLHTELRRRGVLESEGEEPDPAPTMTLIQAREFAKATSFDGDPRFVLARYRHAALILNTELEASEILVECIRSQAVAPQGVLRWEQPRLGLLTGNSMSSDAQYGVSYDGGVWVALSRGIQITQGTVYECMAACEELEGNPDSPPPSGKVKEE